MFEYGFCWTNDNQDGLQNGCCQSVCLCGQSNLVIYYLISFHFIYGLLSSNSRLSLNTGNFYGHSPPSTNTRRFGVSYKRKYVHKVLVPLSQACPGKVLRLTDRLNMTIAYEWDVKPQTKQTKSKTACKITQNTFTLS